MASATEHVARVLELDAPLATDPDTEVSEIQIHPGIEADVAAQLARLDRAIEAP